MPVMQMRTSDDAYPLERLDFGAIDTGTTSVQLGFRLWNDKPISVTGELIGTGVGTRVSFTTQFKPIVQHPNAPVAVFVDGSAASGVTVDYTNGMIVFSAPPALGALVTVDYKYSVGSADAEAVVVTMEQVASFAGNGVSQQFALPSRCITPIKLLVAGVEVAPDTGYVITEEGDALYINEAPANGAAVLFAYVDTVCQGGYYELRSSGIDNPLVYDDIVDDEETAFFKLGGVFSQTGKLIGTGNGSNTVFDTGTPMIVNVSEVTVGGTEVFDYSLNNVTGVITLHTAPANSAQVRIDYTYERSHRIGSIKKWSGRRCYLRASLPYDAPNSVLTARLRVISQ